MRIRDVSKGAHLLRFRIPRDELVTLLQDQIFTVAAVFTVLDPRIVAVRPMRED